MGRSEYSVTASGKNAAPNRIQIYVSQRADKILAKVIKDKGGMTGKTSDRKTLVATLGQIVAHEFGHAWDRHRQLSPRSMGRRPENK